MSATGEPRLMNLGERAPSGLAARADRWVLLSLGCAAAFLLRALFDSPTFLVPPWPQVRSDHLALHGLEHHLSVHLIRWAPTFESVCIGLWGASAVLHGRRRPRLGRTMFVAAAAASLAYTLAMRPGFGDYFVRSAVVSCAVALTPFLDRVESRERRRDVGLTSTALVWACAALALVLFAWEASFQHWADGTGAATSLGETVRWGILGTLAPCALVGAHLTRRASPHRVVGPALAALALFCLLADAVPTPLRRTMTVIHNQTVAPVTVCVGQNPATEGSRCEAVAPGATHVAFWCVPSPGTVAWVEGGHAASVHLGVLPCGTLRAWPREVSVTPTETCAGPWDAARYGPSWAARVDCVRRTATASVP